MPLQYDEIEEVKAIIREELKKVIQERKAQKPISAPPVKPVEKVTKK